MGICMLFFEFACLQNMVATYYSAPQTPGAEASQPRGVSLPGVGPVAQRQEAEALELGRSPEISGDLGG